MEKDTLKLITLECSKIKNFAMGIQLAPETVEQNKTRIDQCLENIKELINN